jgi:hypothetical protein
MARGNTSEGRSAFFLSSPASPTKDITFSEITGKTQGMIMSMMPPRKVASGPNLSAGSGIRPARLRAAAGSLMAGAKDWIVPPVVEVKEVIAPTGFAQAAPCAPGDFGDA